MSLALVACSESDAKALAPREKPSPICSPRARLPAPRCNLAHVVVNGEDLGTHSNVEPIDCPRGG